MRTKAFFVLCLLSLLAAAHMVAQVSTSNITGVVTDPTGAVISGAAVTATNEATGVAYNTITTSSGAYTFSSLSPGQYTIRVSKQGFKTYGSTRNVLTVGVPLVVNLQLHVGAQNESVEVEASYERIETTNATISDVIGIKQVQDLPLNGRNPLSLLALEPGVVQRSYGGAGSGTHVFGSRDRSHNVTVDGIDANESTVPNPQSNIQRLNPDNVQEFRTVTLGATAENGRNSGANVMVATRAGSNSLHGTVFYFNRNTAFNANEWFNNATEQPRPDLKLHQYGFDVGGPIIKSKTFFFGSFQNNLIPQSAPIASFFGVPVVYTNTLRNGIFRFVRGKVTTPTGATFSRNDPQLVDSSGNLLPGIATCSAANGYQNCVDSYNIFANDPAGIGADPATLKFITSLPLPNNSAGGGDGFNTGGFVWNPPTKFTGQHYMVRVDHNFTSNDNIFVRWLQNSYNTKEGDFINGRPMVYPGFPPLGEVTRIGKNLAVSYRHTFSPELVNELTVGFNRFAFAFTFGESNPGFGDGTKLPAWQDSCIYGSFSLLDSPICTTPHTQRAVTTPQIVENLSWVHGAHTIRAGINFRFYIHNDSRGFFGGNALVPGVIFSGSDRPGNFNNIPGTIAGNKATSPNSSDMSNLQQAIVELAGIPYSVGQSFYADFTANKYGNPLYATVYTRAHQYDSYIQDEWKVRQNLTINAGVRWEFNPPPHDAKQTLVPNVAIDGSQGPASFVKADGWFKNNNVTALAPRFGIAWSPDNKTSVRAGYAWLFDTLSTFQVTAMAGKMPGFLMGCTATIDGTGAVGVSAGCTAPSGMANRISSGFPETVPLPTTTPSGALTVLAQPLSTAPGVGAFDPNIKNPSVHEWSLTIQRELPMRFVTEVGYIGKRGTHLYRAYDLNQGSINQTGFLGSFNIARANYLAGCKADGTSTATCTSGQIPTLLLQLVSPTFLNSTSSATDLQRGNIGNMAARMDNLSLTSSQRRNLPLNYFRPNPQFGQIFYQDSGGDSYYHGLFVAVRRRLEQGLEFGFSYTFSKSIDDMSVDPTGATTSGGLSSTSFSRTPTDVHNFRLDRALSDFDNRHVVLAHMLYEFPIGKSKKFFSGAPGWLNHIIGGWSMSGIFDYQSGEPYTLNSNARTTNTSHTSSALIVGPNIPGGNVYYDVSPQIEGPVMYKVDGFVTAPLNDPHLNCQHVTGTETYFCIPPPGQPGSGRNRWQGPNFWNLDSGLIKNFVLTERFRLEFRADIFNVLNHPNFDNPRNASSGTPTITSSMFGWTCCSTVSLPSSQNVTPVGEPYRIIQLGLKLNF